MKYFVEYFGTKFIKNQEEVQFILCSREYIMPNDFYYSYNVPGYHQLDDDDLTILSMNMDGREIKVIGAISQYANWLKVGDELNEKDIKIIPEKKLTDWLWQGYPNNYRPYERMNDIEKRYMGYIKTAKKIVLIKGPCGHFH